MNLKNFHVSHGQDVSLTVCRNAYAYSLNGHMPKTALRVASTLYAQKFINYRLNCIGYRVTKELGRVCIYQLLTESEAAQKALREGKWEYDDRSGCIARLGENYMQVHVKTLEYADNLVVCIYDHGGRFISVVALDGYTHPSQLTCFRNVGHVLAVNALAYYNRYLDNLSIINQHCINSGLDFFGKYLKSQYIELKNGKYYDMHGFSSVMRRGERISHYLSRKSKEIDANIRIASIEVFGDFC